MSEVRFKVVRREAIELHKDRALPPLPRMALNYGKALVTREVRRVQGKRVRATREEIEKFVNFCNGTTTGKMCDWFRVADERCAHPDCGCPLGIKASWLDKCAAGLQ